MLKHRIEESYVSVWDFLCDLGCSALRLLLGFVGLVALAYIAWRLSVAF